jgi:hypothetical protein
MDLRDERAYVRLELEAFARGLSSLLLEQEERLEGLAKDRDVRFAIWLARTRAEDACRYLNCPVQSLPYLLQWLAFVEEWRAAGIREATNAEEAADELTGAADDLHAYLLAHELVSRRYHDESYANAARVRERLDEFFAVNEPALLSV